MTQFSVRCSKCETVHVGDEDNSFVYMANLRVLGWQVPEILENQPILCPVCKKTTNFPTYLGHTP